MSDSGTRAATPSGLRTDVPDTMGDPAPGTDADGPDGTTGDAAADGDAVADGDVDARTADAEAVTDADVDARPADADAAVLAGNPTHSNADVRETYREQANTLDRLDWLNRLFTGRYRRRFEAATGRVLDVACGVGTNAYYVPDDCEYVGIDVSPEVLARAERRLADRRPDATLQEMDAAALAFDDDSFDTVVSSLSTCTFPDPVAALSEMGRVCRPDGRILLVEHGRSSVGLLARFQDWRADAHFEKHNCRWNQDPLAVVDRSPLAVVDATTALVGVITVVEARPRE